MQTHNNGHIVAAAAIILCSGVLLPADQTTTPGQAPVFRSGVELVTVDVGVVDRQGNPVKGLGAGDFVVNVAGHPRKVVTAEFVDVAGARPQTETAPKVTGISTNEGVGVGRMFVFVVDQSTLEPGNVRHVARAASRFFTGLSFVDRSSLVLMPAGPNVDFTWAHDRVQNALAKVIGQASPITSWELGSLTEARDIANRNLVALRTVGQRECGGTFAGGVGGGFDPIGSAAGPPAPTGAPTSPTPGGGTTTGGQGGGGTTTGGGTTSGGGGTGRSGGGGSSGGRNFGTDSCTRDIQMRAEWTWRGAQMTSLSSLTAFRQVLSALEPIPGDKTVILISGGWPLDEREQTALLASVADEAAAARATMFSLFVPGSTSTASRRMASATPTSDHWLHSWPLETLASMSGGASFRVDVGAETAFERLGREMSGFYRLGVEKEPADADGRSRRMRVQVSRGSTTVRAREIFDARTFSDRNASARLASALDSPIPATGIGLRVTSYLASDPEDSSRLKVVLAGEASRVDPGEAEIQLLVRDLEGKKILMGEKPLGEPTGDGLSFSANVTLAPGNYIIRVAVIDGTGRVGSVDHRTDVHASPLGAMSATGPLLVRVPTAGATQPRIAIDSVRQDERLALQVDLASDASLTDADVVFEIASTADGPSLVQSIAQVSPGSRGGYALAQAVADMRVLPPGPYIARAKVRSGTQAVGEVRRSFNVTEPLPAALTDATVVSPTILGRMAPTRAATRPVMSVAPFTIDQVLAPAVLGAFLDRVAARPDAKSASIRDIVELARSAPIEQLQVSDSLIAESPVASFLKGLSLFANKKFDPAAEAFRNAMRASSDFYPAMVYLGACYAAGGRDKEAAGAWRTALIKEADTLPLHMLLADAQLRQNYGDQALETLDGARTRWPADDGLNRRFVLAALLAGEYAEGLQTLDELIERHTDDEPTLAAGLLALYEAFMSGRPVEDSDKDRARMTRLADSYRARGGPSMALVDTWLAAALGKR
jgi:VWFA-related protein